MITMIGGVMKYVSKIGSSRAHSDFFSSDFYSDLIFNSDFDFNRIKNEIQIKND